MALIAGAAFVSGCGAGYLHSHPHACTDGSFSSHRHWHPDDGRGGHHAPEGGDPEYHRSTAYDN